MDLQTGGLPSKLREECTSGLDVDFNAGIIDLGSHAGWFVVHALYYASIIST